MPEGLKWFDTVSILPYWAHTFKKHSAIMTDLRLMIEHLTFNHLDWASNCGEDYFPLKWVSETQSKPMLYLPYKMESADKGFFEEIVSKIGNNMNIARKDYKFDFNIDSKVMKKIFTCLERNQVANIWGPSAKESSTLVTIK